jgi:hypothetical protein
MTIPDSISEGIRLQETAAINLTAKMLLTG